MKMKRFSIKAKDFKRLTQQLPEEVKEALTRENRNNPKVEKVEAEGLEVYLLDGRPLLVAKNRDKVFPSLLFTEALERLPRVVVDMGAVPYVCRGADVMRPGVVKTVGDFGKGMLTVIVDERHLKPIAIGLSLYSSSEIDGLKAGKVVKTVHFVGDQPWILFKDIKHSLGMKSDE